MPSIYVMGSEKLKNYKVMCQVHTWAIVKWFLKLCFSLWNNVYSSIKLKDIGYFLVSYSTIWSYPFQFCVGGFWTWIGGIVGAYDGKSSGYIGSISSIYISLQC
jgi:hypothetical protein